VSAFADKYGPWAVVAGASEGLGAAFAEAIAARGVGVVLLARREAALRAVADELAARHHVEARPVACDLEDAAFPDALAAATEGLTIGLGVYNAAYSFIAPIFERPLSDALRVVDVNVRGPLRFAHALVPPMIERGRGGLVLVASMAGFQGGPRLAPYAASKAFEIVLAESLWAELRPSGVDVLATCPGAVRTPSYLKTTSKEAPGTLDPLDVASRTLDALGSGPTYVPGAVNKMARFFLGRVLPRSTAVGIMQRNTADLRDAGGS
jgi:short-subunit dehydrogenase